MQDIQFLSDIICFIMHKFNVHKKIFTHDNDIKGLLERSSANAQICGFQWHDIYSDVDLIRIQS